MLWFVIFGLIGLFLVVRLWKSYGDFDDKCIGTFVMLMGATSAAAIGMGISSLCADYKWVEDGRWNLHSMKDANSLSGQFFLGCGSVGDEVQYHYTIKTDDGAIFRRRLSEKNTVWTKEVTGEAPVLRRFEKTSVSTLGYWFACFDSRAYEFRVPQGSVYQGFKQDLE